MTMDASDHILVVDDHADIRDLLSQYLKKHGVQVTTASGGEEMKKIVQRQPIDLVVLDIMMPGEDGLTLCQYLRATTQIPVIMLTAVADETDRIIGLEMGADDYLTKPFSPRELLARIKAVLRRSQSLPPQKQQEGVKQFIFDRWTLDVTRRVLLSDDGIGVSLSTSEFDLLSAFVNHAQVVLSRDELLTLTRGKSAVAFDRSIDNQVSRLRRKVEVNPAEPCLIQTIWGGGYKLAAEVARI